MGCNISGVCSVRRWSSTLYGSLGETFRPGLEPRSVWLYEKSVTSQPKGPSKTVEISRILDLRTNPGSLGEAVFVAPESGVEGVF